MRSAILRSVMANAPWTALGSAGPGGSFTEAVDACSVVVVTRPRDVSVELNASLRSDTRPKPADHNG